MKSLFDRFVREDRGQDLIEYGLLAALIALGSVLAITLVGTSLNTTYTSISSQIPTGT